MNATIPSRPATQASRRIYCSRTLNLRAIRAVGYDMDYTLVHYRVEAWEHQAYERIKELLAADGWPVAPLCFDPGLAIRGLIIDTELGNVVKANRLGYVTHATHGTRPMTLQEQRDTYHHVPVDLSAARFVFLNTLFSISETCLYSQLVDLLDAGTLPASLGYADVYRLLRKRLDQTHMEGVLKAKIIEHPEHFVELDPDAALALVDQQQAGKRLMLISNSDWPYARAIMTYAFDRFLPDGMVWQDLFELIIVAANKPHFFSGGQQAFEVVEGSDLLRPLAGAIPGPGIYHGCDATKVEEYLGLAGSRILYVGDHVFADVRMSKSILRWRTALILRELEDEVDAIEGFRSAERVLATMMAEKERLESQYCLARLDLQRLRACYGPQPAASDGDLVAEIEAIRAQLEELDLRIAPLARRAAEVQNPTWGPLLRAGHEKSHLARQIERSADVYTSRVSNFLMATPFAYLRSSRGSMPHDPVLMLAHDSEAGGTQSAWDDRLDGTPGPLPAE